MPEPIRFSGTRSVALPLLSVVAQLSDASFLVLCAPDARVLTAGPDEATFQVKPRLGFFAGSVDILFQVTGRALGQWVEFRSTSRGLGGTSTVLSRLTFRTEGDQTVVDWSAELAERTGMLRLIPESLIRSTAPKVIAEVWAAVESRLTNIGSGG